MAGNQGFQISLGGQHNLNASDLNLDVKASCEVGENNL